MTEQKRLKILIGNDDGIMAPGLWALAKVLGREHSVRIAAPARQKSGFSHAINCGVPLRPVLHDVPGAEMAWGIDDGTPADAMKLGLEVLCKEWHPDLVVAGINDGPNLGTDVFYSGTVGAAFEGLVLGYPVMALSLRDIIKDENFDFVPMAEFSLRLVNWWASQNFEPRTFLNVNFPVYDFDPEKYVLVKAGYRTYDNAFEYGKDEQGEYYIMGGTPMDDMTDPEADVVKSAAGYITISPLTLDATDYTALAALAAQVTHN